MWLVLLIIFNIGYALVLIFLYFFAKHMLYFGKHGIFLLERAKKYRSGKREPLSGDSGDNLLAADEIKNFASGVVFYHNKFEFLRKTAKWTLIVYLLAWVFCALIYVADKISSKAWQ